MPCRAQSQDELYEHVAVEFGAALARLAAAYERNDETRRDLLQEIHVAIWRSFRAFDGRCSLRTWVYRVAHNVATSHVLRESRTNSTRWVDLNEVDVSVADTSAQNRIENDEVIQRLFGLIHGLEPLDRKVVLSYLEGLDGAEIAEITGLSARNVATKIHRLKALLARRFHRGGAHGT